ncbi:MAG: cobalamin-binding protein [Haliscomenobacteraceae bacterium CHB4]|nr:cobalamin-binding protein [Haliscomenobacteraceae bacterium CHB4]
MTTTDQLSRTVTLLIWPPQRIVSVVPSQTELLADLGLEDEVVGITKFCVHPRKWFETKRRVGGTKTLNFEKIEALKPDLIIGNKEENERVQIEELAKRYPVWMSDVATLNDAYDMMRRVGEMTGKDTEARILIEAIQILFAERLQSSTVSRPSPAAYFIWRKPYMIAGGDTFIGEMLRVAGFKNVFEHKSRYPEITLEELAKAGPEVILLSSEPYPFAEKHFAAFHEVCPGTKIRLVDGELFSWYGSRLLHSAAYFEALQKNLT